MRRIGKKQEETGITGKKREEKGILGKKQEKMERIN